MTECPHATLSFFWQVFPPGTQGNRWAKIAEYVQTHAHTDWQRTEKVSHMLMCRTGELVMVGGGEKCVLHVSDCSVSLNLKGGDPEGERAEERQ